MTNAQGIRLLLAEDEWLIVERIERALEGSRYQIAAKAANLRDALRLLDTETFDAAVLDGNLDGDRTWSLAERLRRAGTPFLLLTAYASADRPHSAAGAPAIAKPFAAEALRCALDQLIADQSELI
jgi:DNA-binding response OmpR family regulator